MLDIAVFTARDCCTASLDVVVEARKRSGVCERGAAHRRGSALVEGNSSWPQREDTAPQNRTQELFPRLSNA